MSSCSKRHLTDDNVVTYCGKSWKDNPEDEACLRCEAVRSGRYIESVAKGHNLQVRRSKEVRDVRAATEV